MFSGTSKVLMSYMSYVKWDPADPTYSTTAPDQGCPDLRYEVVYRSY